MTENTNKGRWIFGVVIFIFVVVPILSGIIKERETERQDRSTRCQREIDARATARITNADSIPEVSSDCEEWKQQYDKIISDEVNADRLRDERRQKEEQQRQTELEFNAVKPVLQKACADGNMEACRQLNIMSNK